MGNESSREQNSINHSTPKLANDPSWSLQDLKENELYGDVKVYKNISNHQMCAMKSTFFQDKRAFKQALKQIQGSSVFDVPSLVKILDIETLEETRTCSNFQKIFITFEFFERTLEDEIQQKISERKRFSLKEIYKLIDCVLSAMIFLDFRGKEMLQVSPKKILLDQQNKNDPIPLYKLTDQQLMTNVSDYQRLLIGAVDQDDWMIAPEVMVEVGRRKIKPQVNIQKAQVFTLGMICLYVATLINPHKFKIYDFDTYIVDQEQLEQYLKVFDRDSNLPLQFKQFIVDLVRMDPMHRYNFKEVLEKLTEIQHIDSPSPQDPHKEPIRRIVNETPQKGHVSMSTQKQSSLKKQTEREEDYRLSNRSNPKVQIQEEKHQSSQEPVVYQPKEEEQPQTNQTRQKSLRPAKSTGKITRLRPPTAGTQATASTITKSTKQLYNLSKSPSQASRKANQSTSSLSKASSMQRWK